MLFKQHLGGEGLVFWVTLYIHDVTPVLIISLTITIQIFELTSDHSDSVY